MSNLLLLDIYDRDKLVISSVTKNNVIQGQASWAKMMPPGGKLSAAACNLTKKVKMPNLLQI
jgi:hypothetical protein